MTKKLYTFWRSSAAYRVRIVLNLKGLDYESVPVHFRKEGGQHRKPDFLALNPQGLLPVLQEGDWSIAQSLAIAEYLDEVHPEPPLLPSDPRSRAEVRAMAQIVACEIHPLNNLRVLGYLRERLGQDDAGVNDWYAHWVTISFAALEARLSKFSGNFCFGDNVGLADVCLVPQVYNARRFKVDLGPYPNIERIDTACNELSVFADAAPEQQPDAD